MNGFPGGEQEWLCQSSVMWVSGKNEGTKEAFHAEVLDISEDPRAHFRVELENRREKSFARTICSFTLNKPVVKFMSIGVRFIVCTGLRSGLSCTHRQVSCVLLAAHPRIR